LSAGDLSETSSSAPGSKMLTPLGMSRNSPSKLPSGGHNGAWGHRCAHLSQETAHHGLVDPGDRTRPKGGKDVSTKHRLVADAGLWLQMDRGDKPGVGPLGHGDPTESWVHPGSTSLVGMLSRQPRVGDCFGGERGTVPVAVGPEVASSPPPGRQMVDCSRPSTPGQTSGPRDVAPTMASPADSSGRSPANCGPDASRSVRRGCCSGGYEQRSERDACPPLVLSPT
jgi:hypothetical protein